MFKNEYQGGPFVEIFSAQGKNPGAKWKIFGSPSVIGKEFDKEVKGFVFVLEGSSQTNKMQLPKETRQTLGLIQQFLVLQIYVPLGQDFSTELLITDLGNIKRRLYLSTVHKELSVTPLHAKIPLFMIKRKIWCNLCIDLVAFTSEIFKGAVFQSLDGIIVSANCKLRKIFTLKSKPLDTADEGVDGPIDTIPRACQLHPDVPQVTQLLNMNKLLSPEQKYGGRPLTSPELVDHLLNRGPATSRNTKNQDVSHIAFGSKVLGPPPPSGRRFCTRASGEVTKSGSIRTNRSCQLPTLEKGRELVQDPGRPEHSPSPLDMTLDQGNKENIRSASRILLDKDEWIFPDQDCSQISSSNQLLMTEKDDQVTENKQMAEDQHEDIFTFSSKPRIAPHGKPLNLSSEGCSFLVDLQDEISGVWRGAQMEDDFYGSESSEEGYDWKNYQPSSMSASELQMLASMKRQQNEELEDNGPSHGLSASQIDNCNISISTSSDDTTTWNSCLPAPVNQGCHYQKEMNPLSHSNPRDWLNVFSPPIIPPSQQLIEHSEKTANVTSQGEGDFGAEEDDVLTLLYDPCLNCYFDPETGKYYELA
ncbi:protein CFAP20DC isoform X12 [Hemicordylus capensis]|uniref:protein CFAP20DC isoform X12 n=1 Tax=Hemicordylus capensis TaxID=884348 RepID=UPI0023023B36|nr:protein CFAP20DC isoform X12 [Hemicordylus capensis]